ncbi:hypothetical protein [Streptomyces sp. NPDC001268]|uniref:hypothetical protein n=1 Tax=Streptomyces sp. NPDC001268 TaxID=3364553 RepID=UPI0036C02509
MRHRRKTAPAGTPGPQGARRTGGGTARRRLPLHRRINDLARRITEATRERYGRDAPPALDGASEIPALIQSTVNAASPAWQQLDMLIRAQLDA